MNRFASTVRSGALFCFIALAGVGAGQLRDGTYETRFYDPRTKRVEPQDKKNLPPGQIRIGLIQGKRFAIMDMMVGFQGPIRKKGNIYEFVFEEGPAGKPKGKPDVARVTPSKDKKTLTFVMRGKTMMVWIWQSPTIPIKLPY